MQQHIAARSVIWFAAFAVAGLLFGSPVRADEQTQQILRGFEIAPVKLNLAGKNWALVGLGSYIVNTTGCNDCHTHPNWAPNGNPFLGQTEQINTTQYLSGGRQFLTSTGALIATSANITPDANDRPAGLTLAGFLEVMHYGHDPRDPPGDLLQVMSWPLYRYKTDQELIAIYEYLRQSHRFITTQTQGHSSAKSIRVYVRRYFSQSPRAERQDGPVGCFRSSLQRHLAVFVRCFSLLFRLPATSKTEEICGFGRNRHCIFLE